MESNQSVCAQQFSVMNNYQTGPQRILLYLNKHWESILYE